ncbi:MAG: VanZ family protein [Burkholderiales bacterium]
MRKHATPNLRDASAAGTWLVVYALSIVYVSLTPFTGWSEPETPSRWLNWPHYVTPYDVVINVLAYIPLGLFAYIFLRPRIGPRFATLAATLAGLGLSLGMETAQQYLPTRISSVVDLISNTGGTMIGVMLCAWFAWTPHLEIVSALRDRIFIRGRLANLGQLLLALWFITQLNPSIPFLGAGNVINMLLEPWNSRVDAAAFWIPQAAGMALNFCGIALFISLLIQRALRPAWFAVAVLALALLIKTAAAIMLLKEPLIPNWLGRETLAGLIGGIVLLLMFSSLRRRQRLIVAGLIILAGGVMSKLAAIYDTPNEILRVFKWPYGQLLNFTSLTQFINEAWPLAALVYLIYAHRHHEYWPETR